MLFTLLTSCYPLCSVNYRGSLGYGKAFVEALAGYVGDKYISDCIARLHRHLIPTLQLATYVTILIRPAQSIYSLNIENYWMIECLFMVAHMAVSLAGTSFLALKFSTHQYL